ncbi:hypothetical protein KAS50_03750, partial [bacterium]|nr:hypothetical protein [bacterium]
MRLKNIALFLIFCLLVNADFLYSTEFKMGDMVVISEGDTLTDDFITLSESLRMNGNMRGDIISAGRSLSIHGNVDDDFIGIGENILIDGMVGDDIITAGKTITINGIIIGDVIAAGKEIEIEKNSEIRGNVYTVGGKVIIEGNVKGSVKCYAGDIIVSGIIEKDAEFAYGSSLNFLTGARILGDLKYKAKEENESISEKNYVRGNIEFEKIEKESGFLTGFKISYEIWSFIALFVIGLIMILILKKHIYETVFLIQHRGGLSLGIGLMGIIGIPVIIMISFMLIFTIPMSLILLLLFGIITYISEIYVAIFVGNLILRKKIEGEHSLYLPLFTGLIAIKVLTNIPHIDWFVELMVLLMGVGGIILYFYYSSKRKIEIEAAQP